MIFVPHLCEKSKERGNQSISTSLLPIEVLTKLGFALVRVQGSHLIFKHKDGRITVVPRYGDQEIGRGCIILKLSRLIAKTIGGGGYGTGEEATWST